LTLVEILVSVALLASASVLVMHALAQGAYVSTLAHNRLRAHAFATAKMADLDLSEAQGIAPDPEGQFRIGRQQFQWRVYAAPLQDEPALEEVTLTVDWRQGRHTHESRVSTLRRLPQTPQP
jgi:hypothetical protein